MRTTGVVIVILGLVMTISTGVTHATSDKVADGAAFETQTENHHAINWQQYTGIEVMVLGGAFLAVSRKKVLAARHG